MSCPHQRFIRPSCNSTGEYKQMPGEQHKKTASVALPRNHMITMDTCLTSKTQAFKKFCGLATHQMKYFDLF